MTRTVASCVGVAVVVCLCAGLFGCGGGGAATAGAAAGYVYTLPGLAGSTTTQTLPPIIISADSTPPEGYVAAVGARVLIGEDYIITNQLGFYRLTGLPPGTYEIEVDIDDDGVVDIAVELTILAGQTTWGAGHTEGGG